MAEHGDRGIAKAVRLPPDPSDVSQTPGRSVTDPAIEAEPQSLRRGNPHRRNDMATKTKQRDHTPEYLRCPHCWGGYQGTGTERWHARVSGRVMRYAFRCQLCGHEWTVNKNIQSVVDVETRPIELNTRANNPK